MTVDYDHEVRPGTRYQHHQYRRPVLVYTRKYGWVVCHPEDDADYVFGYSRPGRVQVLDRDVLAIAELPPAPDEAV